MLKPCGGRRSAKFVTARRFGAQQIPNEIVPAPADHIGLVAKSVAAIGEHDQVEVFVGLDQFVDYEKSVVRRDIIVHGAVREQQMALQILRDVLVGLIVVVGAAGGFR